MKSDPIKAVGVLQLNQVIGMAQAIALNLPTTPDGMCLGLLVIYETLEIEARKILPDYKTLNLPDIMKVIRNEFTTVTSYSEIPASGAV